MRRFICYEDYEDRDSRMSNRIYGAIAAFLLIFLLAGGLYLYWLNHVLTV